MKRSITSIRLPLIDNFTRIIKSLASRGRAVYQQYLIHPLTTWSKLTPYESIEKLISMLDEGEKKESKKLPLIYKMALLKSVSPEQLDLSVPGTISIRFLRSMKEIPRLTKSDEALEFINILSTPFKEYSELEFKRMNKKFTDEITTAETVQVEKLIKTHEGMEADRARISTTAENHLDHIKKIVRHSNENEIKREMISHLLKYSSPTYPDMHTPLYEIMDSHEKKFKLLKKEVMDSAAVIIYHEILKAIKNGQLGRAVTFIGKYTVIFRGNPQTPNFEEVDSFEKKFFKIIEERNLWERI
ncbi:MAG TPA: hypothetical protein PK926_05195 [Spirochaetota bacterium]|nr:hypothetical protein [Spirochaetota bacterium]HPI88141.1 hypothetical protein [Spirochaetota bacterium]HPR47916.1 hypothetical protein [Spirochaetota bacterium]